MGLGRRNARQHETVGFQKNALDSSAFWEYKPQQQVMTVDGVPGVVTAVLDGPYPGTEEYEVTLDNGLGGGSYTASQLQPLAGTTASHDHEATGLHLASDDYEELRDILQERPPIERMTFSAARGDNPFEIRHEETDTGGTKFPRRVDMTAHHPETGEEAGRARYYPPKRRGGPISIDEVKGHAPGAASALLNEIESRHPGSSTKFLHEVKRNNNNPDVTGHAHEHAGQPTDWDTHYPNVASTIHRGLSLRLPSYSARTVNSSGSTKDEHLAEIHAAMPTGPNIGTHWTENEHAAQLFANNAVSDHRTDIPVVLHAATPAKKDLETRRDHLYRGGVFPYGDPHSSENEIPVRRGRDVAVTGVSWRPDAAHPDADENGWVHHTYDEPMHHTAAMEDVEDEGTQEAEPEIPPCAYCGSDQMQIVGDNGRAEQAKCQVCHGVMSAPYGLQFKPELIGDPSNHPKDDPDPASGGVPGAANMRVPVKRMNDSDYTASLHEAGRYEYSSPSGWHYDTSINGKVKMTSPEGESHDVWTHGLGIKQFRHPDDMPTPLYHGTPHQIPEGSQIEPGHPGNFVKRMKHVYMVENPEEAAHYAGPYGHVYQVKPTYLYGHRSDAKGKNWATEGPVDIVGVHRGPTHHPGEDGKPVRIEGALRHTAKTLSWDEVGQHYPHIYGDPEVHGEDAEGADGEGIGWAANHLAHSRPDDPEGDEHSVHDLEFHPERVDPRHIDYARHGGPHGDQRVGNAYKGYKSNPDSVPPLVLVHRHGVYQVADGHHRAEAAAAAGVKVRAFVAHSPYPDEPSGDGGKAPYHGAEPLPREVQDENDLHAHMRSEHGYAKDQLSGKSDKDIARYHDQEHFDCPAEFRAKMGNRHTASDDEQDSSYRMQHEAGERDWCTFRHNARCFYPGPLNAEGIRLGTPQDRGPCAWDYWQQQVCPISEPGPMALMQAKGSKIDELQDPDFRFHFTASWSDVRAKARRIRSEGQVNITVATNEGVGGEVKGDHHVYETVLTYVPGTYKVGAWECGCKWAAYAWGRSPAYRRFEGRMCSHALAMQFEAQAKGMFGRAVEPSTERPKWLRHHTPVVTQFERDSGENLTRRAVPPGNMRRTYEGGRNEDFANAVMADYHQLLNGGVYADNHGLDLVHPPVYAYVIAELQDSVDAMNFMAALGMSHSAARAVVKDATAERATGELHFEASLRLLAEEGEHEERERKRCPDCGSMISVNDEKCPHCHHVFSQHEHHHGAKTPGEGDLMSRGMVIGGEWDKDAVHRVMNGNATAHDLLHHIDKSDVGDFWYAHEPHLSHESNISGAKDFAQMETSDHPAEDLDRQHPIGEVGVVLVGHKPHGWDPANNPDDGLMGNSYIPHSADVPLHQIHYHDHNGDWHSVDATGHSVHVHGGGYDRDDSAIHQGAKTPECPTVAGVALKAADTGRILMLQRGLDDEKDPARGTWEIPGGHLEDGDQTSLHGAIREWQEETGQPFPEGGVVHHTWTSPNGIYQGHVVVIPEERAVEFHNGRQVVNPDNPDGDCHEQAAWWDVDHARKNPALREELKTGTPWKEIKAAGNTKTASAQPEYSIQHDEEGPTFEAHSGGQNVGYLTTHDKGDHVLFDGLYVHPDHRSSGIGRQLMNRALDYHQGRQVALKPEPYAEEGQEHASGPSSDQLQQFYSTFGFKPAGEYMTRTAATADPLYGLEEASPMSPPQHSRSQNPASTGWATAQDPDSWDDAENNATNFGALPADGYMGSLHDTPEPALPSTDGAESELDNERQDADQSQYDENDAELTPNTTLASVGTQDIVARFQATAAASALGGGKDGGSHHAAQQANNKEIARAAQEFLTKRALKDFNFAEQQELINEGARDKTMARNSDVLDIKGTHYNALEAALAAEEALEDSAELFV